MSVLFYQYQLFHFVLLGFVVNIRWETMCGARWANVP